MSNADYLLGWREATTIMYERLKKAEAECDRLQEDVIYERERAERLEDELTAAREKL